METLHKDSNKNCMLIVDDDFINREILKNIFVDCYCFEEAENGREGLEKIEKLKDSLCAIILDVNMPVMDGMELLTELYHLRIPQVIPTFLITSNEEYNLAKRAYEMGVMDLIQKPVTPFVVQRRVQSVVELYRARDALRNTVNRQSEQLQQNADTIDALHRNTIEALASAIEFRDMESGEHTNRIYGITKYILSNTAMGDGFSEEEIENIAIGSIMHDIGKIAVSDVILNKPGRLTPEEFEVMKTHTVKGANLMERLFDVQTHDAYRYACDIARHHHERWDGNGYPDGLKGDEITVWSQVVSIADVYDALISPRVYKKPFSPERAVEMIKGGQCGIFNPKLLNCFLEVEPEIRKWYVVDKDANDTVNTVYTSVVPNLSEKREDDIGQPSKELVDVLLMTAALKNAYDMIISVNLTKNTYYMIDYGRFGTHCAESDGMFDDLIDAGASTIPKPYDEMFKDTFSRQKLIEAYEKGKRLVRLEHPQYNDNGEINKVATLVLFMEDPRNGDLREITLSRYI